MAEKDEAQPDTTAVDEKRQRQADAEQGPVSIAEVNTLTPEAGEDVGESQVQAQIDAENEAGFRGAKVDATPNEHYTASNSAPQNDLPTPETDQELRAENRAARRVDGPEPY